MSLTDIVPSLDEFTQFSDEQVAELVYPHQLGVSLLINGTRRWYVSKYLSSPPEDDSYLLHYLQVVLERLAELFTLLASHGVYRVFIRMAFTGCLSRFTRKIKSSAMQLLTTI